MNQSTVKISDLDSEEGSLAAGRLQRQLQQQPPKETSETLFSTTGFSLPADWDEMDKDVLLSKAVNCVFLVICFGLAIYSILDINHGITRGWTQQEIALRIPLDTWSSYEAALEEKPVVTKTMINVIIYLLGDWLSQTVFAKRNVLDFDLTRTLRNGLIGLGFGPLVHQYYQFSDAILPVDGGVSNRIAKIFMDQTIYLSVKCSLYIMAVNTLQGENLKASASAVKEKLPGIVGTAWKFWPLIHCITYSVIPARHRILWVNCVDLVWNAILASMSQKGGEEEEADASVLILEASGEDGSENADKSELREREMTEAISVLLADSEQELGDEELSTTTPTVELVVLEEAENAEDDAEAETNEPATEDALSN